LESLGAFGKNPYFSKDAVGIFEKTPYFSKDGKDAGIFDD
jgi:hypothetical protein